LCGGQAIAQEGTLEEIVVTAQKRAQNQQDVPISVTALGAEYLTEHNVASLQDLAGAVPGLVVTNTLNYGTAPISIRGIGGPNGGGSIFNDEPVAIYVDGVYVARLGAAVTDLLDVDSIQVLRGPQGTLYGRNSTAGAVLLTTKRPTDQFASDLQWTYGEFQQNRMSAAVSGPFASPRVLGRLALGYSDGGNYTDNIADNNRGVGGARGRAARGSLRFLPADELTIDVIADYQDQVAHPALYGLASLAPLTTATFPFTGPIYAGNPFTSRADAQSAIEDNRVALNDPTVTRLRSKNGTVLIDWTLDTVRFASITGYRKFNNDGSQDSDAQPGASTFASSTSGLDLLSNSGSQAHQEYTQELRLQSAKEGRLNWTTGLYYVHEDNDVDFAIASPQAGPPQPGIPPQRPAGTLATFLAAQKLDAYAAFVDVHFALTERFALGVGARYSDERKDVDLQQTVVNATTGAALTAPLAFTGNNTWSNFSPRGVLEYKAAESTLLYASYSRGFKSGGYNSFDATPAASAFPEEDLDAYEIGLKTDLDARRLRVNASLFDYAYRNVQIRQAVFTGGVSVRSVPEARVHGAELETTFAPVHAFLIHANLSYLDATLEKGILQALPSDIGAIRYGAQQFPPPATFPTEDIAGNRMTRAPKWQYSLGGEYTWPARLGDVRLSLTWRGQSSVFFSETNQDMTVFRGEAWNELDVRLGLSDTNGKWDVGLFGRNVLDDRHVTQVAPFSGFPVASVNMPAQYGVQMTYRIRARGTGE
jgi:iron complex outermembrane receptor protein